MENPYTLGRLGSLEDTFTQVYVYDLKEIHRYDHRNTFWDIARHLQNNNSRCLKQFYDRSLILEQGGVWVLGRFYLLFSFLFLTY